MRELSVFGDRSLEQRPRGLFANYSVLPRVGDSKATHGNIEA